MLYERDVTNAFLYDNNDNDDDDDDCYCRSRDVFGHRMPLIDTLLNDENARDETVIIAMSIAILFAKSLIIATVSFVLCLD